MILYGSTTSPYVRHCRIAFTQSGLDWQLSPTDYATSANNSPNKRVPYFTDGELSLTDSAVILRYIREKSAQPYLPTLEDHELFCMATTVLDTAINVFLLELVEGITVDKTAAVDSASIGPGTQNFIQRQHDRIAAGLSHLNEQTLAMQAPYTDGELRVAILLDWGLFRQRISIDELPNLSRFLDNIRKWQPFAETAPNL